MLDDKKLIAIIKKTMPAVVSIVISKHLEDLEKDLPPEMYPFLPTSPDGKKLDIPDTLVDSHGMVEVGGGSGFIVEANGIVVTNKHVLSDPKAEYTVMTATGEKFRAEILTRDPVNDVAILRIPGKNLPAIPLGNASKLELGQSVIAIGNALGIFKNTVSVGIVSGLSRSIAAQAEPSDTYQELRGLIQTDAAINPGNSGGPLVDDKGKAVGINAAIVFGAQNIGFAIPVNAVRRDLDDLAKYGRVRRPYLGVRHISVDENLQAKMKLPVDYGALVVRESQKDHAVIPGSPAAQADIREKDIILEANGVKLDREKTIQDVLENMSVGDTLALKIMRSGKEIHVSVVLAERK